MYNEEEYFTYTNQQTIKANLDGTTRQPEVDMNSLYLVDFSKCQSVNDLMTILSVVGFQFSPSHPGFKYIQQFLALDKPIPTRPQPQAEKASLELPKLKKVK